jgi:hypothetical protein
MGELLLLHYARHPDAKLIGIDLDEAALSMAAFLFFLCWLINNGPRTQSERNALGEKRALRAKQRQLPKKVLQ